MILTPWSDGRKGTLKASSEDATDAAIRSILEEQLASKGHILTVIGKGAAEAPSTPKKEDLLLHSPLHARSGILSYDLFETLLRRVGMPSRQHFLLTLLRRTNTSLQLLRNS